MNQIERRGSLRIKSPVGSSEPQQVLISVAVTAEELSREGRNFNWERPNCPCGCKKVWGHGFVSRLLGGFTVELKRYRCPRCGKMMTMIPEGFWRNCQSSAAFILSTLVERLETFRWPALVTRQRGGFWLRRFQRYAAAFFHSKDQIEVLRLPLELKTCFRL